MLVCVCVGGGGGGGGRGGGTREEGGGACLWLFFFIHSNIQETSKTCNTCNFGPYLVDREGPYQPAYPDILLGHPLSTNGIIGYY